MTTESAASLPRGLHIYSKTMEVVCWISAALAASGLLVSMMLIAWAVAMRYAFNSAPVWVDEAVGFLLVAVVMFSAAPALRRGDHIGVDLLTVALKGGAASAARLWSAMATLAVAAIFILNGWETAMQSKEFGIVTEGVLEWPAWILMMLMPTGGVFLALVSIESIWRTATGYPLPIKHADLDTP